MMRSAVILLAGAAAVSAAVTPTPLLFSRQINYADLVPVGCVEECQVYVKYVSLCGDVVSPQAGDPCMEICKPEEWAQVLPCSHCIGKAVGVDMSNPTYDEPPLACTNPEAYAANGWIGPSEGTPEAGEGGGEVPPTPSAGADAEVTPIAGAVSLAPDASAFKPTSPVAPASRSAASASTDASPSVTPTSGAGKAAVSIVALCAALLFASAF